MGEVGRVVLDRAGLDALVDALTAGGYRVVGPTVRDGAIVLAELTSGADLPDGWGADVGPGSYRLQRRADRAVFAHSAGPQSWKQFLHPAHRPLWSTDDSGRFVAAAIDAPRYAFVGVRACDLAAIDRLTRVLSDGAYALGILIACVLAVAGSIGGHHLGGRLAQRREAELVAYLSDRSRG